MDTISKKYEGFEDYVPTETEAQIANMFEIQKGVLTKTAESLGLHRNTVRYHLNKSPYLQKVRAETKEVIVDIAEGVLLRHLENDSLLAAFFTLKTLGKHRGYTEKSELDVQGGLTIADLVARASSKAKGELPAAEDTVDGEIVE